MSSSEDTPISPKLDVLPRENLSLWKESLEAAALAYCASHGPDGALGLACDAASWQARHPGAVVARPVYPDPGVLEVLESRRRSPRLSSPHSTPFFE